MPEDRKATRPEILIERFLEGTLSRDHEDGLFSWLREHPDHLDAFVRRVDVHASLRQIIPAAADASVGCVPDRAGLRRRRRRAAALAVPIAAAAAVLLVVGARPWKPRGGIRIIERIGAVRVSPQGITTGPDSRCSAEYPDGSFLALDTDSSVRLLPQGQAGGKEIRLERGRVYLDVVPQERPFVIATEEARAEVLGTRLLAARRGNTTSATVVNGRIRVTHGKTGTYARNRDTVIALSDDRPGGADIGVTGGALTLDHLAWLEHLGVDPGEVLAHAGDDPPRAGGGLPDMSVHAVNGGLWNVHTENGDTVVTLESPADPAPTTIRLGRKRWAAGVFEARFRILRRSNTSEVRVNVLLAHEYGSDAFGLRKQLDTQFRDGEWIRLRAGFRATGVNTLEVAFEAVSEEDPSRRFVRRWRKGPERSRFPKRGPCRVGFLCGGCAVEFRDIRVRAGDEVPGR
jgi:hypothetical protein